MTKTGHACFRPRREYASDRSFGPPQRPCWAFVEPLNCCWQGKIGRRERIRTSGPYVPNVVLYQAELLSEPVAKGVPLASGGALITMPPSPRNSQKGAGKALSRPPFKRFAGRAGWLYTEPGRWGVAKW